MSLKKYSLIIQKIQKETNDSITVYFKQPGLRKIKYTAGQYLTLTLNINGRKYKRAYSFSSSPSVDENLKITVKRVPNGIVSNYFLDNIKVGDIIEVSEPMGEFVLDIENIPDQVFFWGAGSGITPIFSMMRELLYSSPSTMIHLTYGNSTNEESIFLKELLDLSDKHKEHFNLNLFFSRDHDKVIELSFSGRINSDFVKDYTMNNSSTIGTSQHFICGPSQMKEMIIESLVNRGLPRESVFSEDFQLTINEQDLIEVIDSEAELHVNGKEFNVLVQRGKTILDAYLDNGIDLPYSCQTGSCKECIARVISGETKMLGQENINDLDKNQTLLCCTYPTSKEIKIEI